MRIELSMARILSYFVNKKVINDYELLCTKQRESKVTLKFMTIAVYSSTRLKIKTSSNT